MPAKYSIVQFTPDPVANERINVGVIVFDAHEVRTHFLSNWERVKRFANIDIQFLQDFAQSCENSTSSNLLLPTIDLYPRLNEEQILLMAREWKNTIQLTEPRGSMKSIDSLLNEVVTRFLVEEVFKRWQKSAASRP